MTVQQSTDAYTTQMQFDTTLSRTELDRMLATIEPAWRITEATPTEAGHHAVYRLALDTPDGSRRCYLKATPAGKSPSIDLEARLLAILTRHTDIPVPTVHGVVDEHDELPTPFVLLEVMPGEAKSRTRLASFSDESLSRIAYDTGRHLADLHSLDVVDAYGFLAHSGPPLHGERPSGDLETIAAADPIGDWRARLRDWADGTLANLEETRFADVAPAAEPVLEARIEAIEGPFEPALARIDQSLENVLLTDGDLRGMIDWEFTIAATPGYDVVTVAWSLAGGQYLFAPGVPDRRDLVRDAVLAGYRDHGDNRVVTQVRANRACYELLSTLRSMVHLADWFELYDLGEQIDGAAAALRSEVSQQL